MHFYILQYIYIYIYICSMSFLTDVIEVITIIIVDSKSDV